MNPNRTCYSKVMHKDKRAAKKAIFDIKHLVQYKLFCYACPYCPGWHLTKINPLEYII